MGTFLERVEITGISVGAEEEGERSGNMVILELLKLLPMMCSSTRPSLAFSCDFGMVNWRLDSGCPSGGRGIQFLFSLLVIVGHFKI